MVLDLLLEIVSATGPSSHDYKLMSQSEVATDALRNILIHLQGTLPRHLWVAQEDDDVTDFNILVEASDFGRIQSVTVLNELYMRMAQAAPLRHTVLPVGRIDTLESTSNLPWENNERVLQNASLEPTFQAALPTRSNQNLQERVSPLNSEDLGVSHAPSSRKKWGIFPASRSHKVSAGMSPQAPNSRPNTDGPTFGTIEDEPGLRDSPFGIEFGVQGPPTWKSSSRMTTGPSSTSQRKTTESLTAAATWKPSPEMVIDEDNPWVSEVSISTISTNLTSNGSPPRLNTPQRGFHQPRRVSTETLVNESDTTTRDSEMTQKDRSSIPQSPPASDVTRLITGVSSQQHSKRPQWKSPLMSPRRTTSEAANGAAERIPPRELNKTPRGSPILSKTQSSPQTPSRITAKNPYGGFCKGAYKLQVGLEKESFKLRNSSTSMTGQSNYWACASSKCAFEGPALSIGKSWTFDSDVRLLNAVQYRWTVLAKSHVALSKVKNREYDYQCVFCDRSDQAATVYRSDRAFIKHVSSHRGQHPATLLSEKVCCIAGRVARKDEDFDINLMPHDELPRVHGQEVDDTPDSLTGKAAQVKTLEDDGAFQWQAIDRPSGTRHMKNDSDASRTLHTLSPSPSIEDRDEGTS